MCCFFSFISKPNDKRIYNKFFTNINIKRGIMATQRTKFVQILGSVCYNNVP